MAYSSEFTRPGDTVKVSDFSKPLRELYSYSEQFATFYSEERIITNADLHVLAGLPCDGIPTVTPLVTILKSVIDEGAGEIGKGLPLELIGSRPMRKILLDRNLAIKDVVPPNYIIPLYDYLQSKQGQLSLTILPVDLKDNPQMDANKRYSYLNKVLKVSDRYKYVVIMRLNDGGELRFYPGRIFKWVKKVEVQDYPIRTDILHLDDYTLNMNCYEMEEILDKYLEIGWLRCPNANELKSKLCGVSLNEYRYNPLLQEG